jgi:hypothetical protein
MNQEHRTGLHKAFMVNGQHNPSLHPPLLVSRDNPLVPSPSSIHKRKKWGRFIAVDLMRRRIFHADFAISQKRFAQQVMPASLHIKNFDRVKILC